MPKTNQHTPFRLVDQYVSFCHWQSYKSEVSSSTLRFPPLHYKTVPVNRTQSLSVIHNDVYCVCILYGNRLSASTTLLVTDQHCTIALYQSTLTQFTTLPSRLEGNMILVLSIVQGKLMISSRVGKHATAIRLELLAAGGSF